MTQEQQHQPDAGDSVSAILEAWRQAERELVAMDGGDGDRRSIEAEIARLRGEYQRLVEPRFHDAGNPDGDARLRTFGLGIPTSPLVQTPRQAIASGQRPLFEVQSRRERDGGYRISVPGLLAGAVRVTSRKGVEAAARARISLLLDVPEDSFDIQVISGRK